MDLELEPPHIKLSILPHPQPPCVTKTFKLFFVEKGIFFLKNKATPRD